MDSALFFVRILLSKYSDPTCVAGDAPCDCGRIGRHVRCPTMNSNHSETGRGRQRVDLALLSVRFSTMIQHVQKRFYQRNLNYLIVAVYSMFHRTSSFQP